MLNSSHDVVRPVIDRPESQMTGASLAEEFAHMPNSPDGTGGYNWQPEHWVYEGLVYKGDVLEVKNSLGVMSAMVVTSVIDEKPIPGMRGSFKF